LGKFGNAARAAQGRSKGDISHGLSFDWISVSYVAFFVNGDAERYHAIKVAGTHE
jgi:hypothetical protein